MSRPNILIDIDGCFADFIDSALEVMAAVTGRRQTSYGKRYTQEEVDNHRMEVAFGLSPAETAAWDKCLRQPGFCSKIKPYPDARRIALELAQIGTLHALTQSFESPTWDQERRLWCELHLDIPSTHVMPVSSACKPLVAGDYLVEDKLSTVLAWEKMNPTGTPLLLRRRYNETEPGFQAFYDYNPRNVCDSLDCIVARIRELESQR